MRERLLPCCVFEYFCQKRGRIVSGDFFSGMTFIRRFLKEEALCEETTPEDEKGKKLSFDKDLLLAKRTPC